MLLGIKEENYNKNWRPHREMRQYYNFLSFKLRISQTFLYISLQELIVIYSTIERHHILERKPQNLIVCTILQSVGKKP
jgi:hypothetical protein